MPAIIFGVIAVGGLVMQAYAQHEAGQAQEAAGAAQKAASDSEADLSDYNANVAMLQSQDAIERGDLAESSFRGQVRSAIGAQRAGMAANGVEVGYGSAVDVQKDAAYLGELDALTIRTNARREAWGYQVQAEDLNARSAIERKTGIYQAAAGSAAATTSNIAAAGTLLGGTASLIGAKYGFGK